MTLDQPVGGRYLITGSQDSKLLLYDTQTFELVHCQEAGVAADCANSVAFHPHAALLLSASGQRHFKDESDSDGEGDGGGGGEGGGEEEEEDEDDVFASLRKARAVASDYSSGLQLGTLKHSKLSLPE